VVVCLLHVKLMMNFSNCKIHATRLISPILVGINTEEKNYFLQVESNVFSWVYIRDRYTTEIRQISSSHDHLAVVRRRY
jgi:hypothetical protein